MAKVKDQPTAHGIKPSAMRERHYRQSSGAEEETIAANGKDAGDYKVEKEEAHLMHVQIEVPSFNATTGEKNSPPPSVQKFTEKTFKAAKDSGAFAGYAVKILHAPKDAAEALGEAGEGARIIDTNYAVMQSRYEALTGEKPEEEWTEFQLDSAIKAAERMALRFAALNNAPKRIEESEAPKHTAPVVATPDVVGVNLAGDAKEAAAVAGKATAEVTPPTGDGLTSVGQPAGRGEIVGGTAGSTGEATDQLKTDAAVAGEPVVATGRRTASPVAKPAAPKPAPKAKEENK